MKYYGVFDAAKPVPHSSVEDTQQKPTHEENQRDKLRIAIRMGDATGDWKLFGKRDRDPNTNDDERRFAAELKRDTTATISNPDPELVTVLAVGRGAVFATSTLAELAKDNSRTIAARTYRPRIANLILVLPELPTDFFAKDGPAIGDGALVHSVCRRIVVVHGSGGLLVSDDSTGSFYLTLGHVGPTGPCLDKALCLDVSRLLISHLPGISCAIESLEVLGLIGRAIAGTGDGQLTALAARSGSTVAPAP